MNFPKIDPRTADLCFRYEPIGEDPDGDYNIGRVYYWFDPQGIEPPVSHRDLRRQHPEIEPGEWRRLSADAFDRAERKFLKELQRTNPDMFNSETGLAAAFLGYTFGPCRPSDETLSELGLD